MMNLGHLTLQIGPFKIDVPLTHKGLDIARDFIDLMGELIQDQSSDKTGEGT